MNRKKILIEQIARTILQRLDEEILKVDLGTLNQKTESLIKDVEGLLDQMIVPEKTKDSAQYKKQMAEYNLLQSRLGQFSRSLKKAHMVFKGKNDLLEPWRDYFGLKNKKDISGRQFDIDTEKRTYSSKRESGLSRAMGGSSGR